jgi:hypothetical protein
LTNKKKVGRLIFLEFDNSYKTEDADTVFGVANVQSGHCSLAVGYFLSDTKLTVLLPETCYYCKKATLCSREFGSQIIRKLNKNSKGNITYFLT